MAQSTPTEHDHSHIRIISAVTIDKDIKTEGQIDTACVYALGDQNENDSGRQAYVPLMTLDIANGGVGRI